MGAHPYQYVIEYQDDPGGGGAYWLTVGGDRQANFHYCALPDPA